MSGNTIPFTNKITSEHVDKPKFFEMVKDTTQQSADIVEFYNQVPLLYDVDLAIGNQLDVVGQWVGVNRNLTTPLAGVYFSFDTVGLGFDEGIWLGPFDPTTGLTVLPDDFYRLVIKVRIVNNHWNCSKQDAYSLMNTVLGPFGYQIYIEDPSDLTMRLGLVGPSTPTAIVQSLLTGGKLNIKPIGVRVTEYFYQSAPGPIFGFDINNSLISGFDTGSWATIINN